MVEEGKILELLVAQHYVSKEDVESAKRAAATGQMSELEFLLSQNIVTKDLVGQAIAENYKVMYADLNTYIPTKDQVLKIPLIVAQKYRTVLFSADGKGTIVTTDDPTQTGLLPAVQKALGVKDVKIAFSLPDDIDQVMLYYKKPLKERLDNIIETHDKITPDIVTEILDEAVVLRASDIHFEPQEKQVLIRYRIDGVMQIVATLKKDQYMNVVNRVKVMSHLRTDQHLAAQDGAIRYKTPKETVDIRVSIVPIFDGEKVVMRLLSAYARSFALSDLGLQPKDEKMIVAESKKPFGMILVAGPTGSGKTTTLYGVLKLLNRPEVNIATIEDPVEYKIQGVNHIQVNIQTELTFARGLRSIVRQDPDVILVGEIRDVETAEISVNAALTGHLLLSTFHANDAATSIPRLLDMNIEPFLLSSTLQAILAQRLVRKICDHCRHSEVVLNAELKSRSAVAAQFFGAKATLYKGKGCVSCADTGYKGRVGIFELIRMTSEMQELIMTNPTSQDVWKLAMSQGASSMFEDGIQKVKEGLTTIEELERVVAPPIYLRYGKAQGQNQKAVAQAPSKEAGQGIEKNKAEAEKA